MVRKIMQRIKNVLYLFFTILLIRVNFFYFENAAVGLISANYQEVWVVLAF